MKQLNKLMITCLGGLLLAIPSLVSATDVDGDGRADFSIWRPGNLTFYTKSPANAQILTRTTLGDAEHGVPLIGDINGNGAADFAVWYSDSGEWHIRYDDDSRDILVLGQAGDIPFLADRNGDGRDDLIVRRPSEGRWYYLTAANAEVQSFDFGRLETDLPLMGYFDNDNQADFAVWRDNGTWYIRNSTTNTTTRPVLGRQVTDIKVPADYDGDGITDLAIWRPSNGRWYIYYSSGQYEGDATRYERVFGKQATDIPVPADYDGDGKADLAIRRPTTGEFIYLSSQNNTIEKMNFGRRETDIPALAPWQLKAALLLEAPEPDENNDDSGNTDTGSDSPGDDNSDEQSSTSPETWYNDNISADIVQTRCIACHVSGGAADGQARLIFERSDVADYQAINQQRINDFLALDDVDADYFMAKASGGLGHIGGAQLPVGSDNYNAFQTYLGLLSGNAGNEEPADSGLEGFWQGATLLSPEFTYRRASLILTGEVPEAEAIMSLQGANDEALSAAILQRLNGDGFHKFLLTAANDRLLTDKFVTRGMEALNEGYFPEIANRSYQAGLIGDEQAREEFWLWRRGVEIGVARAPTELIAYIVQNDRPFTEIVTANYMMLNPFTNDAFRGTANFPDGAGAWDYRPGTITGAMLHDEGFAAEWTEFGLNIMSEGTNINWPHTGVLNDLAWLNRYPSTATNRNRARSRWTYYHFLDFDIEKSAQRTQDPDALADMNNPTMNNANCTVCHQTLDPIAGAYQDYGDWGNYRDQWGGQDSLPRTYKWNEEGETLYQEGDTWYRDMRAPGLEGTTAPAGQDSMQWLGQQIASDSRFAIAMVKFFWPGIFGADPLSPPQSTSDANYSALSAAYNAQSAFIVEVASRLEAHQNMRQMLVELVMSPWFRTSHQNTQVSDAQRSVNVGTERLLTPEELNRKTASLTGYLWYPYNVSWQHNRVVTEWDQTYNIMYGGIDSDGVTKRAREMTSVMSQVALTHAVEASCPVVLQDFIAEDSQRRLFAGITRTTVAGVIQANEVQVSGFGAANSREYNMRFATEAGVRNLSLAYNNHTWEPETGSYRNFFIDHVSVYDSQNNAILSVAGADLDIVSGTPMDGICSNTAWNDVEDTYRPTDRQFWGNCNVNLTLEFEQSGDYLVVMEAYYKEWNYNGEVENQDDGVVGAANVTIALSVTDPITQPSASGEVIRAKIVELIQRFWGKTYDTDHLEVTRILQLFNETIVDRQVRDRSHLIWEWDSGASCHFDTSPWDTEDQWGGSVIGQDPVGALAGWRAVLTYLMSDYQYLHE